MQLLGSRPLTMLPMIVLPIVLSWDAGATTLTHMSVPDDAQQAGQAAVQEIQYMTGNPTPDEAQAAFAAAKQVTDEHGETIDPASFTIYQGGSVKLTVSRSTSTVLFQHLPLLSGFDRTSTTVVVSRSSY